MEVAIVIGALITVLCGAACFIGMDEFDAWWGLPLGIGGLFGAIGGIILIIGALIYAGERKSCNKWANLNDYERDYSFWTGCQVYLNGQWIADDKVIVTDERE